MEENNFNTEIEEMKTEEPVEEPAPEETAGEAAPEEPVDEEPAEEVKGEINAEDLKHKAEDIVEKIKEIVKEGNVSRIRIRREDNVILNLPLTVGVVGTILGLAAAPWAVIIATVTTIGLNCTVEVEKKDGSITVIHGKKN